MASPGNQHCANCIGTLSFPMIARVSVSDRLIQRRHQKYFLRGYTPSSHAESGSTSLMPGTFRGQSWSSNPPFSPCPRSRHVLNTRNPTQPFTREIANLSSVDALRTSVDTVRRRRGRTAAVALAVDKCINGRRTDGRTRGAPVFITTPARPPPEHVNLPLQLARMLHGPHIAISHSERKCAE